MASIDDLPLNKLRRLMNHHDFDKYAALMDLYPRKLVDLNIISDYLSRHNLISSDEIRNLHQEYLDLSEDGGSDMEPLTTREEYDNYTKAIDRVFDGEEDFNQRLEAQKRLIEMVQKAKREMRMNGGV